jgi:predicted Rdx family selenoprotein
MPDIMDDQELEEREYICFACKQKVSSLDGHHLSYEPEIIVPLCKMCHYLLHTMARNKEILSLFIEWIERYSYQWTNGNKKYKQSNYCKEKQRKRDSSKEGKDKKRKYGQSDKCKAKRKIYRETNKELLKQRRKEFYRLNRERILAKSRTSESKTKRKICDLRNKDKIKEQQKRWRENNRDRLRQLYHKYNAEREMKNAA